MNEEEGTRSREAVRNSIRTYGVKVMDPASLPLKKTKETESQESVSRFSEKSLHSQYEIREGMCKRLLNRIPYATLLAMVVCILGVLIVATCIQRAAVLTRAMIQEHLHRDSELITVFDIFFLVIEIITVILAVMIFIIGILATGDTRARVYKVWQARIGGRICCATLMVLTFILFLIWMAIFWILASLCFMVAVATINCDLVKDATDHRGCISLPMLNFFFPGSNENVEVCGFAEIKKFCKDYVEKVSVSYIMAEFGSFLVVISMVLFLICLAANYARIRCQAKFQELRELHNLEIDLQGSKDRF